MREYTYQKKMSDRDRDFMRACRQVIARSADPHLTIEKVAAAASAMKAPSYYVEYTYAIRKLNSLDARRQTLDSKLCNNRWIEIRSRVGQLMARHGLKRNEALARVIREGGASSFFLSPRSATRLYLRLRHSSRRAGPAAQPIVQPD